MEKNTKKEGIDIDFSSYDYSQLRRIYDDLKEHIDRIESKKRIPLSLFSSELSGLETIVKYFKENVGLSFKDIAFMVGRSPKTIWQAYNFSKKKYPKKFIVKDFSHTVPLEIFRDRKYSILEHIVLYLKKKNMKLSEIGILLHRNPSTIWTVNSRANKK